MKEYLTFDDVLIQPQYSDIESRDEISTALNFLGLDLKLPVISAPMDYVTGADMANAMLKEGSFYVHHRFLPTDDLKRELSKINGLRSVAVGVREVSLDIIRDADFVTIDVAHGEHKKVIDLITYIKGNYSCKIIAGNVASWAAFARLANAGADAIKVGIGPGSVCTTRDVTGIGVPQFTALQDIFAKRHSYPDVKIIVDGGIKTSGDIVKALAAGADAVMLGRMLAGATETPGKPFVLPGGQMMKRYRGQASFGTNQSQYAPEGIEGMVPFTGSVEYTLKKISGGLRSGMSYVGARNLAELRENAEFIRVSPNTHIESGTRVEQYDQREPNPSMDLYNGANPSRRE